MLGFVCHNFHRICEYASRIRKAVDGQGLIKMSIIQYIDFLKRISQKNITISIEFEETMN